MGIDATMLIRNVPPVSESQLKEWNWHLISTFGKDNFFGINREKGESAIRISEENGTVFYTDATDPEVRPGEQFLEVKLMSRYYGEGYERGDLTTICAIAEWIEQNIPNSEVWYGGDSSGIELVRFDKIERERLKHHLYSVSGKDYFNDRQSDNKTRPNLSNCNLCIPEKSIVQYGWSGNGLYHAYACSGCGESFITRDGGTTWDNKD